MSGKPSEIESGRLCSMAIDAMYRTASGLKNFPQLMRKIIETRAWERRVSHGTIVELASLRELITLPPIQGWGEDIRKIEAIIKDEPEVLLLFREATLGEHGGDKKSQEAINDYNIINDRSPVGTSKAYSLKQVVEKCDKEVAAEVLAGKLSPNKALVQAGLRENRQVYMPKDPEQAAEKLRKQFGADFFDAFARVIAASDRLLEAEEPQQRCKDEAAVKAFDRCDNRLNVLHLIVQRLEKHERAVVAEWLAAEE